MGHGGFGGFHGGGGFRLGGGHGFGGIGRISPAGHPNLGQHLQQQHLQRMQQELHALQQHQLQAAQRYHQQLAQAHQQMLAEANQLHQLKLNNAHLQQEVNQGNTVNINRNRNVNNGNIASGESSIANNSGAGAGSSFASILPSLLYTLPMYMMMMNRGGYGGMGGMGGWPGYGGGMGGWPGYGGGFMPYANWNNPGGRWNNRFQPQPNMEQMQQFQQMLVVAELNDLRTWAAQGWINVPPNSPLYSLVYPGQRGTPPGTIVPPPPVPNPPGDVPLLPNSPLPGNQNYYAPADQGNYNLTSADGPYANNVVYGSPYYSNTNCGSRRRPFAFVGRALHNLFS